MQQGYKKLREIPYVPPCPSMWKGLWKQTSIPKIDLFNWLLCHNRVLTADNLRRKGIHGPSRCPLCQASYENVQHIMLDCGYAIEVWGEALSEWNTNFTLPSSIFDLYANWEHHFPGQLPKNTWIKAGWLILPKVVCWHIWLERNSKIFQEKAHKAIVVLIKIKTMLKEILSENVGKLIDKNLSNHEKEWAELLGLQIHNAESHQGKNKDSQISMTKEHFRKKKKQGNGLLHIVLRWGSKR